MRKLLFFAVLSGILSLYSCSKPTPEQLAKDVCDCVQKTKNIQNADNQIKATVQCSEMMSEKMRTMRGIEQDMDMNDEQVEKFEARFDKAYQQCK